MRGKGVEKRQEKENRQKGKLKKWRRNWIPDGKREGEKRGAGVQPLTMEKQTYFWVKTKRSGKQK